MESTMKQGSTAMRKSHRTNARTNGHPIIFQSREHSRASQSSSDTATIVSSSSKSNRCSISRRKTDVETRNRELCT